MLSLLGNFGAYAGVGLGILLLAIFVIEWINPIKIFALIHNGNEAASIMIGGKVTGLAITLAFAIANSISLLDLLLWAAIALVVQFMAFYAYELLTPRMNVRQAIESNNIAVARFSQAISIAAGLIIGACLTYDVTP